jgi:hypothetical protein
MLSYTFFLLSIRGLRSWSFAVEFWYPLYNSLSDERMAFPLMNTLGLSSGVRIAHLIENSFFWTTQKSFVSTGFADLIMPILHILCYNGSLVTWTVATLTTADCSPHYIDRHGPRSKRLFHYYVFSRVPQSRSLAMVVVLSPVYKAVTW